MRNRPEIIHFETWGWSWTWTWRVLWTRGQMFSWSWIKLRTQLYTTEQKGNCEQNGSRNILTKW